MFVRITTDDTWPRRNHFYIGETTEKPENPPRPCDSLICGTSAQCRVESGLAKCFCPPSYLGDPYTACRPECVVNSECPADKTCSQKKCVDPCAGTCGSNAECRVSNHIPVCSCAQGFSGDPYSSCQPLPVICKQRTNYYLTNCNFLCSLLFSSWLDNFGIWSPFVY